jgi:hypothetical protein
MKLKDGPETVSMFTVKTLEQIWVLALNARFSTLRVRKRG